jgi:hypothetical protein
MKDYFKEKSIKKAQKQFQSSSEEEQMTSEKRKRDNDTG